MKIIELEHDLRGIVLATVIKTSGSTPQKPGSTALIREGRILSGTVGGGISEGRVLKAASEYSNTGKSGVLKILLNSDISEKEEAICGGEMSVLIDADPARNLDVYRQIVNSIARREPGIMVSTVKQAAPEDVSTVVRYWITRNNPSSLPDETRNRILAEAYRILDNPGRGSFYTLEEESSGLVFLEPILPKKKLLIAGAGHVGKALSHLGKLLDFEVTVVDDRSEFANPSNLPDADNIIVKNIGKVLSEVEKDPDTYIVIVTRGHKDDAEALKPCIGSGAIYIGMIGSRIKIARMKTEFLSQGWATEEEWSKIHAPIGIDINSVTVEEIAVSIAAQLVKVRNEA